MLGATGKKGAQQLTAVPENLKYHRQTPGGARDNKLLKRKWGNLSTCEITCTSPEKTHPQKRIKRLAESLARLISESLSLYEASP